MEKTIEIDGRDVKFKATGATIRLYRQIYHRDILMDMTRLQKETADDSKPLSGETLNIFENIAYLMAKQADPTVPDTADEWLDQFDMFSIYRILPQIIALWGVNTASLSESKKKALGQTGL